MRIFKLLIVSLVAVAFFSCEPTYEKEYSWAYPIAGDWTVTAYVDGEAATDPFEIKAYNSAFGQDSIWIDDYPTYSTAGVLNGWNFWAMKFKIGANMSTKTFGTAESRNAVIGYEELTVVVTNGKVIGTDSITMDIEFSDDLGTIYQLAGHRTTSYEEYMGQQAEDTSD